jgi:hypothetical protein
MCRKAVYEYRDKARKEMDDNDKHYTTKTKEVKTNMKRIKDEFKDINLLRNQEYANYCIFLNS